MDVDEGGWTVSATDSQLERERDGFLEILRDLIAELVGDDGDGHELTPEGSACTVCEAIDKAEARLREVGGDE